VKNPVRVPEAGQRVIAAFDFDGTLTRGGSVWRFLIAASGVRRALSSLVVVLPRLIAAAVLGGDRADGAKEELFAHALSGLSFEDVARTSDWFGRTHYIKRSRADVADRLEWHRKYGDTLVIVSASPELYLQPVAEILDVDKVIATRLEVTDDGILTGRYDGPNCRGKAKIEGLLSWAGSPRPFIWAYGNSAGDLQLLEGADIGVNVGRLGRLGRLRNFVRLSEVTRWPRTDPSQAAEDSQS